MCYLKFFQQYTGNNFLWELVSISGMVSHDSVDPSSLLKINNLFLFFFSKKKRNGSLPLANKNEFSLRFKGILRLHFDVSRLVLSESLALLTILKKFTYLLYLLNYQCMWWKAQLYWLSGGKINSLRQVFRINSTRDGLKKRYGLQPWFQVHT